MRFSLWPSPQRPWSEVLDRAAYAADTGWDGVWFADHFMPNAEDVSAPMLECWSVLAGLAVTVPRVRIGALVTGNTYRHPAVLANMAVTVDHISGGGRLVLGLGGGWQENEHRAYGIEFGTVNERLAKLEEACQVITGLLSGERADFDGRHYHLAQAPLEPKPVQGHIPLLVGGGGEKVTMRIAAQYADEWNVWGTPDILRQKGEVLERHCQAVGRDPAEIQRSAQAILFLSDDEAWLGEKRQQAVGMPAIVGTPGEVADVVQDYAKAGVDELIVPDWNLGPIERTRATMDLFMSEVAPAFR
jgi:F420-dependent oxidoreductase-like protein